MGKDGVDRFKAAFPDAVARGRKAKSKERDTGRRRDRDAKHGEDWADDAEKRIRADMEAEGHESDEDAINGDQPHLDDGDDRAEQDRLEKEARERKEREERERKVNEERERAEREERERREKEERERADLAARLDSYIRNEIEQLVVEAWQLSASALQGQNVVRAEWKALASELKSDLAAGALRAIEVRADALKRRVEAMIAMFKGAPEGEKLIDIIARHPLIGRWKDLDLAFAQAVAAADAEAPDAGAYRDAVTRMIDCDALYTAMESDFLLMKGLQNDLAGRLKRLNGMSMQCSGRAAPGPNIFARIDPVFAILKDGVTPECLANSPVVQMGNDLNLLIAWAGIVEGCFTNQMEFDLMLCFGRATTKEFTPTKPHTDAAARLWNALFDDIGANAASIRAAHLALLHLKGPWSARLAKEQSDQQLVQLATYMQTPAWGLNAMQARARADVLFSIKKAIVPVICGGVTQATFNAFLTHLAWDDSQVVEYMCALNDVPRLTALATNYLPTCAIGPANFTAHLGAGRIRLDNSVRSFEYHGCIEVELFAYWDRDDFPGGKTYCMVHVHYSTTTTANPANATYIHLKDPGTRQLGGSSLGAIAAAGVRNAILGVIPTNLSI